MSKCFIVPAYIYNNLLEKGDDEQKLLASNVLDTIKKFFIDPEKALQEYLESINGKGEAETEAADRLIYDAGHKMVLPGKLVRKEGEGSKGDGSVDKAYDYSGNVFDFLFEKFGRNSIDDAGMALKSTVHYGKKFANAFWNGSSMTYGCGDGQIFKSFLILDVVAHEFFHGATEKSAGLIYSHQSGALNESFSDVFGSMVKQYVLDQTSEQADWLIGEGLFTNKVVNGRALRDLKNPGTAYGPDPAIGSDPQPNHMDRYVETDQDAGGVHINSSIPNRAFYKTAMNIGGYSWERAGKIWYQSLMTELKPKSQFQDTANATVKVAGKLYGDKSVEQKGVIEGWKFVGIQPKL